MTSRSEIVLDIKSLIADTHMLSTTEFGAYALLLFAMHSSADGWIDEFDMQRIAHMADQNRNWQRVRTTLERFLITRDGRVTQKRIQRDRNMRFPESDSGRTPESDSGKNLHAHIESNSHTLRLPLQTGNTGESVSRATARAPRTAPIPENWQPTIADFEYAKKHGFSREQALDLAEGFFAHHRGKGNRWTDWHLAWTTWVRNEVKWKRKHGTGRSNGTRTGISEAWDKLIQRADEDAEDSASRQGSMRLIPSR